jgi:uncharacterized protein
MNADLPAEPGNADEDPALQAFLGVWETLNRFGEGHDACYADGFLTAVAASRRHLTTDEWLAPLTGDSFDRAFADPESANQARDALSAWLARRREELEPQRLLDEPEACFITPLFDEWTDELRAEMAQTEPAAADEINSLQTGVLWAEGFLDAVGDFEADWPTPADTDDSADAQAYRAMTQLIACLVLSPEDEEAKAFFASQWKGAPPTRDELLTEACFAVQDLRVYWLDHGPKPEQRKVQALPGRNDPCHCGSGKKFKKCHGQTA